MKKLSNKFGLAVSSIAAALPAITHAEPPTGISPVDSSAGDIRVQDLLVKVINWILLFAAAVAVLFLVIGGLQYVTSAGNKERIDKAKQTILYAVIGIIVIALSFAIVTFISTNVKSAVQ